MRKEVFKYSKYMDTSKLQFKHFYFPFNSRLLSPSEQVTPALNSEAVIPQQQSINMGYTATLMSTHGQSSDTAYMEPEVQQFYHSSGDSPFKFY